MASKEELADWNRRVRRLAQNYAPKYRPVVLSLGYHTNLDEGLGRTYIKVETIIKESARYTASGKPLQDRYVKRLLAEMVREGAVKVEARYREDTGRRTSSYRTLNTAVAMDRHGFTRAHDFWAPFDKFPQVDEKKDTPQDTPQDTTQDTRTGFELDSDCQGTALHLSPADAGVGMAASSSRSIERPAGAEDAQEDGPHSWSPWQTWFIWRAKTGRLACFSAGDIDMGKVPGRAIRFDLRPEDAKWIWETISSWGNVSTEKHGILIARSFGTAEELAMLGIDRAA